MKKAWKVLAAAVCLLLLTGLLAFIFVPRQKLWSYLIPALTDIRITHAHLTGATARMKVQLELSAGLVPVLVDSLSYDFRVYGQSLARGQQQFTTNARSRQGQQLIIPVTLNHNRTRELVRRQLAEGRQTQALIRAGCRFPLMGTRQIDIDQSVDLVLPVLPGAEITGLKITDPGLDSMAMTMSMSIDNPNNFDLYLRHLTYTIQLKDYVRATGEIRQPYLIRARQRTTIALPATADLKRSLEAGWRVLTGNATWPYHMKSEMVLEPRSGIVGKVHMNTDKYGLIDVVDKLQELRQIKKQQKEDPGIP